MSARRILTCVGGGVLSLLGLCCWQPVFTKPAIQGPVLRHSDDVIKHVYEPGNVEKMVHGTDDTIGTRVDNSNYPPYTAGNMDVLRVAFRNVHDPKSRKEVPLAGSQVPELVAMGKKRGEEMADGKPTVVDTEHLMHGDGGHDHDVKRLSLLKTKEDTVAQDVLGDLHALLMHSPGHEDDDDEMSRPGKEITYKDIMDLGLDEETLRGIDLKKVLLQHASDYDDWQRDREAIQGESPEGSFREQVKKLVKRYSASLNEDNTVGDGK